MLRAVDQRSNFCEARKYFFLSAISGLLSGLSFNFPFLSFLAWFSFAPLFYILQTTSRSGRYFFVAGVIHYVTMLFWLSYVSRLGLGLLICYLSLYWAVFGWMSRFFIRMKGTVFALSALWVIFEFIRENLPGIGFGWGIVGYSQYPNIFIAHTSALLGVKFISFLIIAVNAKIGEWLFRRRFDIGSLILGCFFIVSCFGYSWHLNHTKKPDTYLSVTVVQPNISQELKWNPLARSFIIHTLKLLGQEADGNLLLYPEASWPTIVALDDTAVLKCLAQDTASDIFIGAVIEEDERRYNAALLINKQGDTQGVYRKIRLVPFGEYVPFRRVFRFISVINELGDMFPGNKPVVFNYAGLRIGAVICFEDAFPFLVTDISRGSDALFAITNDAWFGGQPEAYQHFAIMAFRAIENRISIVRSANTGMSGYVDYLGRSYILNDSGQTVFFDDTKRLLVPVSFKKSFYSRFDILFALICISIVAGMMLVARRKKPCS